MQDKDQFNSTLPSSHQLRHDQAITEPVLTSIRANRPAKIRKRQREPVLSELCPWGHRSPDLRRLFSRYLPPLWNASWVCRRTWDRL